MSMKQFAIVGLGSFGRTLAIELEKMGHEVLAIDKDENNIMEIKDHVTLAVQADATDKGVFDSLNISDFDALIIAVGSDLSESVLISMTALESGVARVLARASSPMHEKIMRKVGVDSIIYPERDMAIKTAHTITSTNVLEHIILSEKFSMANIKVPADWVGRSLKELSIRAVYKVNIMAITNGDDVIISPDAERIFKESDILALVAKTEDLEALETSV